MDSASLDDLWNEPCVYAANTTEIMMDGKAYYRAVRAHQLTYEAPWWIKWEMFEAWLTANDGHDIDIQITDLALKISQLFKQTDGGNRTDICDAVNQLSSTICSEKTQELMKLFEMSHEKNPNFKLWSPYMKMVEILLDFIRAYRDGYWSLHLQT